ncbi:MAG: alpha/beta hydrolase [Devosia sp.]|nr:alpha/beta hydrolase [Devosia sp.]
MTAEIDPDMLPILEAMRAAAPVDYAAMPIAEARTIFDAGTAPWRALAPEVPEVEDLTLAGAAGPMRARLYRPAFGRLPLVVFVHGGGWTFGSVDSHENEMRFLALASRAAVLGFDYRLGPEHPFPAGLDDILAVLAQVRAGALGDRVDASRLALAGDSAGANLALGALLALRDKGAAQVSGAMLFYGCYAPDFDTESHRLFGGGQFGLSTARMRWYWRNFLGPAFDAPMAWAAPLGADLGGLPPLHLVAAGLDPLRDDTLALARRLSAAGIEHELVTVPGVIHGFLGRAPKLPVARRTMESAGAFLTQRLEQE